MQSVCVFCGANRGLNPEYENVTRRLGTLLTERDIRMVFGAGKVGLMGVLADTVLDAGGTAIGVVPWFLQQLEVVHEQLSELHVVDTMHQRKQKMAELSDAFIVMPGGYGTLDEFFEILTWKQLRLHQKPIGVLNHDGYYDYLIAHLDRMVAEGFLRPENRGLVIIEADLYILMSRLMEYQPVPAATKWLDIT
jgi:hypothetical protein